MSAEPTPEEKAACDRVLSRLEGEADVWSAEVNLPGMIDNVSGIWRLNRNAPEDARSHFEGRYKAAIDAIVRQAFIEGAYRMYLAAPEHVKSAIAAPVEPNDKTP